MFADPRVARRKRRAIVLVVILGMLALLALIGVTFATLSGQARINARNYMQAQQQPDANEMFDFALSQLINDTGLPTSAIRGHSLKRDMYGNDAQNNGFLALSPIPPNNPMHITGSMVFSSPSGVNYAKLCTDIAAPDTSGSFYGYDFTRWYVRLVNAITFLPDGTPISQTIPPAQTFEVLVCDFSGTDSTFPKSLVLTVGIPAGMAPALGAGDTQTFIQQPPALSPTQLQLQGSTPAASAVPFYATSTSNPFVAGFGAPFAPPTNMTPAYAYAPGPIMPLTQPTGTPGLNPSTNIPFVLDGRYLRAFNGPGMDGLGAVIGQRGASMYANFRVNGGIVQSLANGLAPTLANASPVFPGSPDNPIPLTGGISAMFPGMDEDYDACDLENWFLALQSADGQIIIPSFHRPGIIQYDPTNGVNDWQSANATSAAKFLRPRAFDGHSSISFPDLIANQNNGRITYDIDNDGDGVTDSVWLDLGYAPRRDASGKLFKPLFAFMVIGLNGRMPLNTVGNLSLRSNSGTPLYAQATHLGNSPSEIDPTWALQNFNSNSAYGYAWDQLDNAAVVNVNGTNVNAGIPVTVTQLRNLLCGTVPYDGGILNGDVNTVNTQTIHGTNALPLPNNVADVNDANPISLTINGVNGIGIQRKNPPVPGRWGDVGLIPSQAPSGPISGMSYPPLFSPTSGPLNFQTPVAPGRASFGYVAGNGLTYIAGTGDDNSNVFDPGAPPLDPSGELTASYDLAFGIFRPVERIRRFVNPTDPTGDAQILTFDDNSLAVGNATGIGNPGVTTYNNPLFPLINDTGDDHFGRVGFFKYFRPPGIAQATGSYPWVPASPIIPFTSAVIPDLTNNQYHGFEAQRNPKLHVALDPNSPGYFYPINPIIAGMPYDISQNALQVEKTSVPIPYANLSVSSNPNAAPYLVPQPGPLPPTCGPWIFDYLASGGAVYDVYIPSGNQLGGSNVQSPGTPFFWPFAIGNMNEPEEMNLYNASVTDLPFGPSDLEWLYRYQDSDGTTLSSRLQHLAPVSFTNTFDGSRRRRLFSIDSWDPTSIIWTNDNTISPNYLGVTGNNLPFSTNSRFPSLGDVNPYGATFPILQQYVDPANASFQNLPGQNSVNSFPLYPNTVNNNLTINQDPLRWTIMAPLSGTTNNYAGLVPPNPPPANSAQTYFTPTPSLTHRDRKINLNFPLPVSNNPAEPVRQKWIRETYQLLKAILPPRSVDTPAELAQLSQFVVNIIDFRDPDGACTKFVNTDLTVTPGVSGAIVGTTPSAPILNFTPLNTNGNQPPFPDYSPNYTSANSSYLVQYGMEYPPIAINEVLAFKFQSMAGSSGSSMTPNPDTTRLFVEVVNMLTESNTNYPTPPIPTGVTPAPTLLSQEQLDNPCDMDMKGWDFVILPDGPLGRPDPYNGQIPAQSPANITAFPVGWGGVPTVPLPTGVPAGYVTTSGSSTGLTSPGSATPANPVFSNFLPLPSLAWVVPPNPPTIPAGIKYTPGIGPTTLSTTGAWASHLVPALNAGSDPKGNGSDRAQNYYYVFGNLAATPGPRGGAATRPGVTPIPGPSTTSDYNPPQVETYLDMTAALNASGSGTGPYYWIYLRRPANPLDDWYNPDAPNENRVVVDSFRFYCNSAQGYTMPAASGGGTQVFQANSEYLYSLQRLQPYRGGQMVAAYPQPAAGTFPSQIAAYGFMEQVTFDFPTAGFNAGNPGTNDYAGLFQGGGSNAPTPIAPGTNSVPYPFSTQPIGHTIGGPNDPPGRVTVGDDRDMFVFNDRDFTSVAELMLVPGCPPGLFTKQFVEIPPQLVPITAGQSPVAIIIGPGGVPVGGGSKPGPPSGNLSLSWINTYGYQPPGPTVSPNGFQYPAASGVTSPGPVLTTPWPATFTSGGGAANTGNGAVALTPPVFGPANPTEPKPSSPGVVNITAPAGVSHPRSYPYLVDNFFYTAAPEYVYPLSAAGNTAISPPYSGGPSGAGWYKMFSFFEVPSPAIDATGMVAQGNNLDWFRQDRKPGLINLNLIIDEEVFLGLMGFDSSDSYQQAVLTSQTATPTQTRLQLNMNPLSNNAPTPAIVTQLNANGYPSAAVSMPNLGAFVATLPAGAGTSDLKGCFVDFLRLRSGGVGTYDANGNSDANFLYGLAGGVPVDRPFHSLSYPDINYTVMRPAYPPPPPAAAGPVPTGGVWPPGAWGYSTATPIHATDLPGTTGTWSAWLFGGTPGAYIQDPGVMNPYLAASSLPVQLPPIQPPPIPARRLFQIPDADGSPTPGNANLTTYGLSQQPTAGSVLLPPNNTPYAATAVDWPGSNASVFGDPTVNAQVADPNGIMFNPNYDLTAMSFPNLNNNTNDPIPYVGPVWLGNHNGGVGPANPANTGSGGAGYDGIYDGVNSVAGRLLPTVPFQQADERQSPYFRSEWMQRMLNLTTERTHQYAVWITVGFFEVTQAGNPALASSSNPSAAYDRLGLELGALGGTNTRFRGFFILDRTRSAGFNPSNPGDFHDVIVYRKLIE